jgi:undecaprenyl-diphosphatase
MVGEIVLELLLKAVYQRERPVPFFDFPLPSSSSFPSGHAMGSLCFYGITAFILARYINNRNIHLAITAAAVLLILGIGTARVYLGVHYPSDVLAGYLAGSVWLGAVIYTNKYVRRGQD